MNPLPDADVDADAGAEAGPAPPSVEEDHARVREMMGSPQMQRRLEEARAQREKVLAERAATRQAEPAEPDGRPDGGWSPGIGSDVVPFLSDAGGPALPEDRTPQPSASVVVATAPAIVAPGPDPLQRRRPRLHALSMVIGLVLGLALGAGLMRLVEVASPLRLGVPGAAATSAGADPPAGIEGEGDGAVAAGSSPNPEVAPPPESVPREADGSAAPIAPGLTGIPPVLPGRRSPQALALPSSDRLPPAATSQAADAPSGAGEAAEASTGTLAGLDWRVTLHLSTELAPDVLQEAQAALRTVGVELTGTSVSRVGVSRSQVRFFHGEDASDALQIARAMGAQARDFTAFRPQPPPGTFEVWLAGEAQPSD